MRFDWFLCKGLINKIQLKQLKPNFCNGTHCNLKSCNKNTLNESERDEQKAKGKNVHKKLFGWSFLAPLINDKLFIYVLGQASSIWHAK